MINEPELTDREWRELTANMRATGGKGVAV